MFLARNPGTLMPMFAVVVLVSSPHQPSALAGTPIGSAFTYQGHLKQNGAAYSGTADFQFRLFATPTGGTPIGSTQAMDNVTVTSGVFTASMNFGPLAFDGQERWLEIAVDAPSDGGAGPFTTLTPRQLLTAAPYAAFSLTAGSIDAGNISTGTLDPARLPLSGAWNLAGFLNIGSNSLVIDDAGSVGIGTALPEAALHVAGEPGIDGIMFPDGSLQVTAAVGSAIRATVSLDVPLLSPLSSTVQVLTIPGASPGSSVSISPTTADLPDFMVIAWARVSEADTVRVRFLNVHPTITVNASEQNYTIAVFP